MLRWAWRLARRETPQQLLLVTLLSLACAVSVGGLTAAHQLAGAADVGEFGTASAVLDLTQTDERSLALDVPAARSQLGTVDVVRRQSLTVPGLFEPVELRQQAVPGHFTRPLVAVVGGRLPTAPGEVALAPDLATILGSALGRDVQLGGRDLSVVGLVENPADLDDAFALVTQLPGGADSASFYVDAPAGLAEGFRPPSGATAVVKTRSPGTVALADGAALVASCVLLLLVALVAVAAFSVVAQRRLPQLGLLAATGATRRQLGWVMTGHGALVGTFSAIVGAAVALAAWPVAAARLEPLLSYRIDTTDIPWLFVAAATCPDHRRRDRRSLLAGKGAPRPPHHRGAVRSPPPQRPHDDRSPVGRPGAARDRPGGAPAVRTAGQPHLPTAHRGRGRARHRGHGRRRPPPDRDGRTPWGKRVGRRAAGGPEPGAAPTPFGGGAGRPQSHHRAGRCHRGHHVLGRVRRRRRKPLGSTGDAAGRRDPLQRRCRPDPGALARRGGPTGRKPRTTSRGSSVARP